MTPMTAVRSNWPAPPATLGESPLWQRGEQSLYYVDIAERQVLRLDPRSGASEDAGSSTASPAASRGLKAVACWWPSATACGASTRSPACTPPSPPRPMTAASSASTTASPTPRGVSGSARSTTLAPPEAALYRYAAGAFTTHGRRHRHLQRPGLEPRSAPAVLVGHQGARDLPAELRPGHRRHRRAPALRQFAPRAEGQSLDDYGGRPDGAAVDVEGCYWVAMFEGQRLLRLVARGSGLARS